MAGSEFTPEMRSLANIVAIPVEETIGVKQ
jgi:hypothetical protein